MPPKSRFGQCLAGFGKQFAQAGIETGLLDARLIVQHVTRLSHAQLIARSDEVVPSQQLKKIKVLAEQRLTGMPVSKILGVKEFYGREFEVSTDVLDPRPDTETLIDVVLKLFSNHPSELNILDLGTGSGAIGVSLLCELKNARAVATDISAKALEIARRNAIRHGVDDRLILQELSWCEGLKQKFDIIVSNPPYIRADEISSLSREVREFDPLLALDGGADGLDCYRVLANQCAAKLKPKGIVCVEIGYDQAKAVSKILAEAGFSKHPSVEKVTTDLSGNDRVVTVVET